MMTTNVFNGSLLLSAGNKKASAWLIALLSVVAFSCGVNAGEQPEQPDTTREQKPGTGQTLSKDSRPANVNFVGGELYTLYIENTSANPQLYRLLGDKDKKEKVVFQFFTDPDSNRLGLYAFPGTNVKGGLSAKTRGVFDSTDTLQLQFSSVVKDNLNGKKVVLSGVQLQEDDVDSLRKYMVKENERNKPGAEFIWFEPRIQTIAGLQYVVYEIKRSAVVPAQFGIMITAFSLAEANPSPPRKTY